MGMESRGMSIENSKFPQVDQKFPLEGLCHEVRSHLCTLIQTVTVCSDQCSGFTSKISPCLLQNIVCPGHCNNKRVPKGRNYQWGPYLSWVCVF